LSGEVIKTKISDLEPKFNSNPSRKLSFDGKSNVFLISKDNATHVNYSVNFLEYNKSEESKGSVELAYTLDSGAFHQLLLNYKLPNKSDNGSAYNSQQCH